MLSKTLLLAILGICLFHPTLGTPVEGLKESQQVTVDDVKLLDQPRPVVKETSLTEERVDEQNLDANVADTSKSDLDTANTFWGGFGGYYRRPYYGGYGGGWRRGWGGNGGYGGYTGYGRGYGGWGWGLGSGYSGWGSRGYW